MKNSISYGTVEGDPLCECDNCGHQSHCSELAEIDDLLERLTVGGEVPAGECPKCRCLSYLVKDEPILDSTAPIRNCKCGSAMRGIWLWDDDQITDHAFNVFGCEECGRMLKVMVTEGDRKLWIEMEQ